MRRAVVASLLVAAATHAEPEPQPAPAIEATNALVVVLDALTAKRSSAHGYARPTTPTLERLARTGFQFTRAHSQATSTLPSAWSYFSGRYPYRPRPERPVIRLRAADPSLAAAFQRAGFATGGFSENPYVAEPFGFARGFDAFAYTPYTQSEAPATARVRDAAQSRRVVADARDWIASVRERPWFAYVHLLRPHNPYSAPEPNLSAFGGARALRLRELEITARFNREGRAPGAAETAWLGDLYDGNVAFADALVGELVAALGSLGELRETLVVVMSDHGEAFMEHGRILHGHLPYQEEIHVPLVFHAPGASGLRIGRSDAVVELIDVHATLVEVFGLALDAPGDGRSLVPLLTGSAAARDDAAAFSENLPTGSIALRVGDRKLIAERRADGAGFARVRLFDLAGDPGERRDLSAARPAVAAALLERVRAYDAVRREGAGMPESAIPATELERLRALGYVD